METRYFTHATLRQGGYKSLKRTLKSPAAFWEMRKLAIEFDVPQESMRAFRMKSGKWRAYLAPGAVQGSGYVSCSVLPERK